MHTTGRIPVLFQGCDGWSQGLRSINPAWHARTVGIELDPWSTRTAAAAGHHPIRADVETFPLDHLPPAEGVIASPPCQAFSLAGKGDGRALVDDLARAACAGETRHDLPVGVRLVLEPTRWIRRLRPRWIAMEQVPSVLPIWEGYRWWLRTLGYSTWAGILNAANYGVPQTRKRAILIASLDRAVTAPPTTHSETPGLFGHPSWVSMNQALGWGYNDRPARTVCGNRQPRWLYEDRDGTHGIVLDRRIRSRDGRGGMYPTPPVPATRPAPTLTAQGVASQAVWVDGDQRRQLATAEALTLQSFPPDYPVQGNRTARGNQIGNAMPPLLAAHALAAAGVPVTADLGCSLVAADPEPRETERP